MRIEDTGFRRLLMAGSAGAALVLSLATAQVAMAQDSTPAADTPAAAAPSDLQAYLDGVEREILERALERHRNNRTAAGASLGLSLKVTSDFLYPSAVAVSGAPACAFRLMPNPRTKELSG